MQTFHSGDSQVPLDLNKDGLYAVMKRAAKNSFPHESCGLIVRQGSKQRFVEVPNYSANPANQFLMRSEDVKRIANDGEILGVWHTHVNQSPKPSMSDISSCEATCVPWFIISAYGKDPESLSYSDIETLTPSGVEIEYVGRPYVFGSMDCWTLVRDYYRREFGVVIGDYPRIHDFWKSGFDFFGDKENWEKEGLYRIENASQMKNGDLIFFSTDGSGKPNHAAIYVGDDQILHHVTGRLSRREVFYGYWEKCATVILRCKHVSR